ncbi:MAG: hypothetical protein ACRCSG_00385 [Cellulosilyticaceae bacterium]
MKKFKTDVLKSLMTSEISRSDENSVNIKIEHLSRMEKKGKKIIEKYDEFIKLLPGIKASNLDVDKEELYVEFDKNQFDDQQVVKWIKIIIDVMIEEYDFIKENLNNDLDKVTTELKNKLSEKVKDVIEK